MSASQDYRYVPIAHDLLKGIISYDLMYCIKYFVKEGWFNYMFLNTRL